MKYVSLLLLASLWLFRTQAQSAPNPYPRTINVTGSAELEVVPDEIYVQVDLKEYEKKGQGKISIEKIRQQFLSTVRSLGLPDSSINIAAYDSYNANPWLRKKKKKEELYASISYLVKLKSSAQVDALVDRLDDEATQNFFIQRTSHSRLTEYRRQLKIAAVKAAKEKAAYLAEAIGDQVGDAVTIYEPVEHYIPFYNQPMSNMMVRTKAAEGANMAPEAGNADFTKIRLKYDVTVTFALK